ncbi:hypothetical protein JY97_14250 [Alkalispirochaeta odontotermitis]|nr:hypothetical protein JY97_14250 [Alkalispirochaeta odontotermitis]CAB1078034.1 hypothetical protein D1AOALGA4SA_5800 [Olavius algarvensis Delta 1 endosymbiont]
MGKFERILNLFPSFYRANEHTKLLYEVIRLLAMPLEEADTHLFRIQRAHRLRVAEHPKDIMRLAAVLNLTPFHFEDILNADIFDYEQKLTLMRERVQRIARIQLTGLGTPWAVMQSAAIFLNATIVPQNSSTKTIKHLDPEGFSHSAEIEFTHLPKKPRERIYLHENPFRRKKEPIADRWPPLFWTINNESMMTNAPVKIVLKGHGDRTVLPYIYCPKSKEGLLFNGVIPDGSTLIIDSSNGATLDDVPVDDWLIYYQGGAAEFARADNDDFTQEESTNKTPFDGSIESITMSPNRRNSSVPNIPAGRSRWHFYVTEGVYDGHTYDYAVFGLPHLPIGEYDRDFQFDQCTFEYDSSAKFGMAWDERIPYAVKLLLPHEIPGLDSDEQFKVEDDTDPSPPPIGNTSNHIARVGTIVSRFRAAGMRAFVDRAPDAWILGESVIRKSNSTEKIGTGVHSTRLRDQRSELLVSPE